MYFIYSNNSIGPRSLKKLYLCHGNLVELKLQNVKFEGKFDGLNLKKQFLKFFSDEDASPHLMRLTLNRIDLNQKEVFTGLLNLLSNKPYL